MRGPTHHIHHTDTEPSQTERSFLMPPLSHNLFDWRGIVPEPLLFGGTAREEKEDETKPVKPLRRQNESVALCFSFCSQHTELGPHGCRFFVTQRSTGLLHPRARGWVDHHSKTGTPATTDIPCCCQPSLFFLFRGRLSSRLDPSEREKKEARLGKPHL